MDYENQYEYTSDFWYNDPSLRRRPVFAHRLMRATNLSAPRNLQRIPHDALPGVTMVFGWTNLPRRKTHNNMQTLYNNVHGRSGIVGF